MKSYKEMLEMIEAQSKAIEYLFQTVDDHCKRIEELEKKVKMTNYRIEEVV